MIGTSLTDSGFHAVTQVQDLVSGAQCAVIQPLVPGIQRRTHGSHQTCSSRPGDRHPQFQFKRPEHRIIEKRATLHDDVLAQLLSLFQADDFVQCVFDHGHRQPGGNILHGRTIFLSLLHR